MEHNNLKLMIEQLPPRSLNSTLFNIALAYAEAGNLAWKELGKTKNADYAAPAIMSQSFAIELLLKFFVVIEYPDLSYAEIEGKGIKLKGHKYSELYDRIVPKLKDNIAASYAKLTGQRKDASSFRELLLALGDDPFVYWRYIFEKVGYSQIDVPLLGQVMNALGKAAEVERKRISQPGRLANKMK